MRAPQCGKHGLRTVTVKSNVNRTAVLIAIKNFLPRSAAIGGAKNTTLRVGPISMSHGCHQNYIGSARVYHDAADVAGIAQSYIAPALAAICGLIDPVAVGEIRAPVSLATAHINNVRIGWSNGQRANRSNRLAVKSRGPGQAAVGGFPHSSAHAAKVVGVGLVLDAAHGNASAATKWADHPPPHSRQGIG